MSDLTAIALDGNIYPVDRSEVKWRPSVYGIVIDEEKILLSPQHGLGYELPGGGMEIGETFEQAVAREVKEETGIVVVARKLIDVRTSLFVWKPTDLDERSVQQSVMLYYLCDKVGGELSMDGFDANEQQYAMLAEWMSLQELENLNIASTVDFRPIVRLAIEGLRK